MRIRLEWLMTVLAICVGDWGDENLGRGCAPSPEKNFDFWAQKGEFWCILGATFAVELNENWLGY